MLPKMRVAAGVLAELKKEDPDTDISMHYIRKLIKSGKIPVVSSGNRKLVNVADVVEYLKNGDDEPSPPSGIRRVDE